MPTSILHFTLFTHVPLSSSNIIWYQSQGSDVLDWEGNRKAGVALTMRLKTSVVYPPYGLKA